MGLTLSGCATYRTQSTAEERVSLDYSPAYSVVFASGASVKVNKARAYQDGDEFVVSGRVKRMHRVQLPGHIDLAICDPDGVLLAQETTRIQGLSSNRKGVLNLPFRFRLAMVPPEGAKIRLQYHAPASAKMDLSCQKS
jgi:hypothetical protein